MKTTIDIADALLDAAKRQAARDGTTLRALVESGLRQVLAERKGKTVPFKLRDLSVKGKGLHPDVGEGRWEDIMRLIYEGRSG